MTDMIRLTGFVLILIATVVAAVLQQSDEANDLELKVRTVAYWLSPGRKRSDELTTAAQTETRYLDEKTRAVQRLLDGRATLFETAAVFHHLTQQSLQEEMLLVYPEMRSRSAEERACLQVIRWVANDSRGTARLVARLQEELRQYKEQYGTVILPDAEPAY